MERVGLNARFAVVSDFFRSYSREIDDATFKRLFTPISNSAKSANAGVRADAVKLYTDITGGESKLSGAVASDQQRLQNGHRVTVATPLHGHLRRQTLRCTLRPIVIRCNL